jgi:hypothetical protein
MADLLRVSRSDFKSQNRYVHAILREYFGEFIDFLLKFGLVIRKRLQFFLHEIRHSHVLGPIHLRNFPYTNEESITLYMY